MVILMIQAAEVSINVLWIRPIVYKCNKQYLGGGNSTRRIVDGAARDALQICACFAARFDGCGCLTNTAALEIGEAAWDTPITADDCNGPAVKRTWELCNTILGCLLNADEAPRYANNALESEDLKALSGGDDSPGFDSTCAEALELEMSSTSRFAPGHGCPEFVVAISHPCVKYPFFAASEELSDEVLCPSSSRLNMRYDWKPKKRSIDKPELLLRRILSLSRAVLHQLQPISEPYQIAYNSCLELSLREKYGARYYK